MTTTKKSKSPQPCAVRRGPVDRVLSGLAAVTLLGAARRLDGLPALGLAALGGVLLGRMLSGHRVGRAVLPRDEHEHDVVDQAGHESFPASDPPSWSPTAPGAAAPTAARA